MDQFTNFQSNFRNRGEAGKALAKKLADRAIYSTGNKTLVLSLPGGGVLIGYEIARELHAPLDTIVVEKLKPSQNPDFSVGAIAPGDILIIDAQAVAAMGLTENELDDLLGMEREKLEEHVEYYRSGKYCGGEEFEEVIIADDGFTSVLAAMAAIESTKLILKPKKLTFAVPLCVSESALQLSAHVDEFVYIFSPLDSASFDLSHLDFSQVSDQEIMDYLERANRYEGEA